MRLHNTVPELTEIFCPEFQEYIPLRYILRPVAIPFAEPTNEQHQQKQEEVSTKWIFEDTDDFIRLRPECITWNIGNFSVFDVPPIDPLSHLYSSNRPDLPMEDDGSKNTSLKTTTSTNTNHTTTLVLPIGDCTGKIQVQIPKEPLSGVPGQAVVSVGFMLLRRRPLRSNDYIDPIAIFKAWIPPLTSLAQVEEESSQSNQKMLLFADCLLTGIHGWPTDPDRAYKCYKAAALGIQENEGDPRCGLPVGEPEAMLGMASMQSYYLQKRLGDLLGDRRVEIGSVFDAALQSDECIGLVFAIIYWVAAAARLGYISILSLDIANHVATIKLVNDSRVQNGGKYAAYKSDLELLVAAGEYKKTELSFQERQETGEMLRGDPPEEIMCSFGAKSSQIYCNMPIASDELHLEYRQLPHAPFRYVVYALDPQQKYLIKVVILPDDLQLCPFSNESFQFVWHRIVFELHLGNVKTRERSRPRSFTVLNSDGNRRFAEFLRRTTKGSGTVIRSVSHMESILLSGGCGREWSDLGTIVQEIEERISIFLKNKRSEDQLLQPQISSIYRLANEAANAMYIDYTREEVEKRARDMKIQGNRLFLSSDFVGATKCYSTVLELGRRLPEHPDEIKVLLLTTLSNRAASSLERERREGSSTLKRALCKAVIKDCSVALSSSWSSLLPQRLLEKLKLRRDRGRGRLDFLQEISRPEIEAIALLDFRNEYQGLQQPQQSSSLQKDGEAPPSFVFEDLLLEEGGTLYDHTLAKNSKEGCPICLRRFDGELSNTYSAILPCGEHAVCAECICTLKKQSDREGTEITCPLCRFEFDGSIIQRLAYQIVEKDAILSGLVQKFPADDQESIEVAIKLLWKSNFRVDEAVDALEGILDDNISSTFFRTSSDLTHDQKEVIYHRARRPIKDLEERAKTLRAEQRKTFDTKTLVDLNKKLKAARTKLATARLKARDEIYESMNTVGNMGAQDLENHDMISVDFHGLHVQEMNYKYAELVEPLLPVVKKITVITGRGLHSSGGQSKLMKALKKKVSRDKSTRWERVAKNPGALIIHWTGE